MKVGEAGLPHLEYYSQCLAKVNVGFSQSVAHLLSL